MSKHLGFTAIPVALISLTSCVNGDVAPSHRTTEASGSSYSIDIDGERSIACRSYSDLVPAGRMGLATLGDGTVDVTLDVTNFGDDPIMGTSWRVWIDGELFQGELDQAAGGTALTPNTVNPHESGKITLNVAAGTFARCETHDVQIEIDAWEKCASWNGTVSVVTPCITWTSIIDEFNLGTVPDAALTLSKTTIQDIVSSFVVVRADKNKCSFCHHKNTLPPFKYKPPVEQDKSALIGPNDVVSGLRWSDPGGWAEQIQGQGVGSGTGANKAQYILDLFRVWMDDGYR